MFAVEDTRVQLTWSALPAQVVTIEVGGAAVDVIASPPAFLGRRGRRPRALGPRGPGAVDVAGLDPACTYDVCVRPEGGPRVKVAEVTTLAPPPGRLLGRVATVNDIHIGDRSFGVFGTIEEARPLPRGWEPHALRCARAALREAADWGAELVVVKGDLTRDSKRGEFHQAGRLLASARIPVLANLGNHDVRYGVDGPGVLAGYGIDVATEACAHDVAGLRIVLGHTPDPHHRRGHVEAEQRARLAELAGGADGAAMVLLHHQLELSALRRFYPPGVPAAEAVPLLDTLAAANPATLVSGGHTHRTRRHDRGPVVITEIGSTKDYPGVWAGYAVHEGGIRQVVRRVAEPAAIAWNEATAQALYGLWGRWAPGKLAQRCFSHTWPRRHG